MLRQSASQFFSKEDAMNKDQATEILAETENLIAWLSHEEAGQVYHLELGTLSLHLMPEEWDELVVLIESVVSKQ
jgi:hypothetical protein